MIKIKNTQVLKAVRLINLAIIEFIIRKDGVTSVEALEEFISIKELSTDLVANLLKILVEDGYIEVVGNVISGSVAGLKKIMRDEQIALPGCYGHPWSEDDFIELSEMQMKGIPVHNIAKKMKRTEQSIRLQASSLRKAYKLIEIVKRNPIVLEFVKTTSFPNVNIQK